MEEDVQEAVALVADSVAGTVGIAADTVAVGTATVGTVGVVGVVGAVGTVVGAEIVEVAGIAAAVGTIALVAVEAAEVAVADPVAVACFALASSAAAFACAA